MGFRIARRRGFQHSQHELSLGPRMELWPRWDRGIGLPPKRQAQNDAGAHPSRTAGLIRRQDAWPRTTTRTKDTPGWLNARSDNDLTYWGI